MSLHEALDLNENGGLGWPDLLGWLFFGTVGLLGLAVLLGMALGLATATGRGALVVVRTARMWRR